MQLKQPNEYPDRDLTPEHTKRSGTDHGADSPASLHPEVEAAYNYVDSVLDTSDFRGAYAWHGWALREAFLAGISFAEIGKDMETHEDDVIVLSANAPKWARFIAQNSLGDWYAFEFAPSWGEECEWDAARGQCQLLYQGAPVRKPARQTLERVKNWSV